MKIITVDKPYEEGKWLVKSNRFKLGETFKEWLVRVEEEIKRKSIILGKEIEGIYLYDIGILQQEVDGKLEICCYPRYDFIIKETI
jgi:hypothetical protein